MSEPAYFTIVTLFPVTIFFLAMIVSSLTLPAIMCHPCLRPMLNVAGPLPLCPAVSDGDGLPSPSLSPRTAYTHRHVHVTRPCTWAPRSPSMGVLSTPDGPHDRLCDKLHALCRSSSSREPTNCLTNNDAGSQRRPDLAVENIFSGGRVLLVDATTADPSAMTNINQHKSHRKPGAAAEAGGSRKRTEYDGTFNRGTYAFTPLSVELTGRWGRDLAGFFKTVCGKARDLHGYNATQHGYFVSQWRSRLAIGLTKSFAQQAVWMKK